jgi:hypothetical protein
MINILIFLNKCRRVVTIFQLFNFLLNFFKGKPLWLDLLNLWDSYFLKRRKIEILFFNWLYLINRKTVANLLIIALWRNLVVLLNFLSFYRKLILFLSRNFLEKAINISFCSFPTHPLCLIRFVVNLFRFLYWRDSNLRRIHFFRGILNKQRIFHFFIFLRLLLFVFLSQLSYFNMNIVSF